MQNFSSDWVHLSAGEANHRRPSRRGLANPRGAHNCFLNVIIQCLWGLDSFLGPFMQSKCHVCKDFEQNAAHNPAYNPADNPTPSSEQAQSGEESDHSSNPEMPSSCIHCPLRLLFLLLRYDQAPSLTPMVLRVALSSFQSKLHRFQLQEMEDASECLVSLLKGICCSLPAPPAPGDSAPQPPNNFAEMCVEQCHGFQCPSHQAFGLRIREENLCACSAEAADQLPKVRESWSFEFLVHSSLLQSTGIAHRLKYPTQPPHMSPMDTLEPQAASKAAAAEADSAEKKQKKKNRFSLRKSKIEEDVPPPPPKGQPVKFNDEAIKQTEGFEQTLLKFEQNLRGECPRCHVPLAPRTLLHVPPVFVLNVAWDSMQVEKKELEQVFDGISPFLDVGKVFEEVISEEPTEMYLQCMVCYYGEHYVAFCFSWASAQWIMLDDTANKSVGQWKDVTAKCVASKFQPLLLFYTKFCSTFDKEVEFQPPSALELIRTNKLLEKVTVFTKKLEMAGELNPAEGQ